MKIKQNTIGNKAKRKIQKNRHNRMWEIQKEISAEIEAMKKENPVYDLDETYWIFNEE